MSSTLVILAVWQRDSCCSPAPLYEPLRKGIRPNHASVACKLNGSLEVLQRINGFLYCRDLTKKITSKNKINKQTIKKSWHASRHLRNDFFQTWYDNRYYSTWHFNGSLSGLDFDSRPQGCNEQTLLCHLSHKDHNWFGWIWYAAGTSWISYSFVSPPVFKRENPKWIYGKNKSSTHTHAHTLTHTHTHTHTLSHTHTHTHTQRHAHTHTLADIWTFQYQFLSNLVWR